MNSKSIFYTLLPMGCIVIAIYVIIYYTAPSFKERFNHFNRSNINGKISFLGIKYKGPCFNINGNNNEFTFHPYISKLDSNKIFEDFAEIGDSINKRPYSDTLYLIKKGVVFRFTFFKPDI